MILVAGASGVLGRRICRELRARGAGLRALVRTSSPRQEELLALGAAIAFGDLKEPASLAAACEGVETVVTTATCISSRGPGDSLRAVDRDGQLALLEAARRAGIRRFVYISLSPERRPTSEFVRIKRLVEREVRASGLEWAILQPAAFLEIWLSPLLGWDIPGGRARILGKGHRPASLVSVHDVGRVAAAAAVRPEFARRNVPVGGPEALSPNEILGLAEKIMGRRFRVQRAPLAVLKLLRAVLIPLAPIPASLISLGIDSAETGDVIDSSALWRELGLTPMTIPGFVAAAAAAR